MNLRELKENLYDITRTYFGNMPDDGVVWADGNTAKPTLPFVMLKTGPLTPSGNSIQGPNDTRLYVMKTVWEVDLYTPGAERGGEDGDAPARENTAVNDLLDFVNFLRSDYATDLAESLNITISLMGSVTDVTALLNEIGQEFRAMAEFQVTFIQAAGGYAGVSTPGWKPTSSGGGTEDLAAKETGYFEKVVIKEESL